MGLRFLIRRRLAILAAPGHPLGSGDLLLARLIVAMLKSSPMGRKRIMRPGLDPRLGKQINCRFPRDIETAIEAMAEAQEGYPQDAIRELVIEALTLRANDSQAMAHRISAARRAGETSGYAECNSRWRKKLAALAENPPPDEI